MGSHSPRRVTHWRNSLRIPLILTGIVLVNLALSATARGE